MLNRIGSIVDLCVMYVLFLIFWIIRCIQNVRRTSIPEELPLNLRQPILNLPVTVDIPSEVWTDIFQFLPRATLVQHIQPVNHWFMEICDKNVKNIHVIRWARDFLQQLSNFDPVAMQDLEDLASNKCPLAGHFRILHISGYVLKHEEMRDILCHCLDMFQGCQIRINYFNSYEYSGVVIDQFLAYLNLLEAAKPSQIFLYLPNCSFKKTKLSSFLKHSTVLNCNRLIFKGQILDTNLQDIFDWLHHRVEVDNVEEGLGHETRCLIVSHVYLTSSFNEHLEYIQWLLECCVQNFLHTRDPLNCRQFVFGFKYFGPATDLDYFERVENPSTGEVLLLERVMEAYDSDDDEDNKYDVPIFNPHYGPDHNVATMFRFTRCLANQIANGTDNSMQNCSNLSGDSTTMEISVRKCQLNWQLAIELEVKEDGGN